jgi:hypothetical protein
MMTLSFYSLIQVYRYRPTAPEYLSIMLLALAWDVGGVRLKAGDRETAQSPNILRLCRYRRSRIQYTPAIIPKTNTASRTIYLNEEASTGIVMY